VGVQFVRNVEPYERMKLRLLNASHSALGYLGFLAGLTFVHEAASDPQLSELVRRFMAHEVSPLLPTLPGMDVSAYQRSIMQRFQNVALGDTLTRICAQGSAKMPKFVLASVREQLARGLPAPLTILVVAAYLRYLAGVNEAGAPYAIDDPLAPELTRRARQGGKSPLALLHTRALFGADLPQHPTFVAELSRVLERLYEHGVRNTLTTYLEAQPGV
jgi:mannitol-1-phosphate/altronate dehydrogenase